MANPWAEVDREIEIMREYDHNVSKLAERIAELKAVRDDCWSQLQRADKRIAELERERDAEQAAIKELETVNDTIAELVDEREALKNALMLSEGALLNARAEERERFSELKAAAEEIDTYLCENKLNQVGASSLLHNKLRRGLKTIRALEDK